MDKIWYDLARRILKNGGPPVPLNDTLIELLKTLINEDQAKFLLTFRKPLNFDQLKEKTGLDDETLKNKLEELMHIGFITALPSRSTGIMVYRLVSFLPGLLEFTLMRGETGEKQKKIALLWDKLFKEEGEITQKNYDIVMNAFKNAPPIDRVITINQEVEVRQEMTLLADEVNALVNKFDTIAVSYCYCRHRKDLLNEPCKINAPRQNCLSFGRSAEFLIEHDFARKIDKDEALRILKEAEELGLVHKAFHSKGDPNEDELAVCNCCKCCCENFQSFYTGRAPTHTYATHIAKVSEDKCIGCQTCVSYCPLEAIEVPDTIAQVNNNRCMGCGVCASKCPEEAIILEKTELRKVFIPTLKIF